MHDVTYSSRIFLVELRSVHCTLDVVCDVCLAGKACEGGRKRTLDVLCRCSVERQRQAAEVELRCRVVRPARIVEGELELKRVFVLTNVESVAVILPS